MVQIDRMEIADAGGNPRRLAEAILKQLPDLSPPVPVREIASAIDIREIREETLSGMEGALITDAERSNGEILIRADLPEVRKRYTIAHELGHYVNPWHQSSSPHRFECTREHMEMVIHDPDDHAAQMEVEANIFAAELLMPHRLVSAFMKPRRGVELTHVLDFAKRFEVSKEASARRYVALGEEPSAIIFSKDCAIRYIQRHKEFPRLSVWNGDPLPAGSLSPAHDIPNGDVSDWAELSPEIWLEQSRGSNILEQTLAQKDGYRMTLLTLDEVIDEDSEDTSETDWPEPTFKR